jgi:predicted glycosyltransferase
MAADRPLRLLTYSHDGCGLGHLRRTSTVARALLDRHSRASALVMTGCPTQPFLIAEDRLDVLKLPSIRKVATGQWQPRALDLTWDEMRDLRAALIRDAAQVFDPDLFVVDYTPLGVGQELLPALQLLRRQKRARIVLLLRDVLDAPEVTCRLWREDGVYPALRAYYDRILICGEKAMIPTAQLYGLDDHVPERVHYCGYVTHAQPSKGRCGRAGSPLLVVAAGGGADAYPMMSAVLDALPALRQRGPLSCLIVSGPLMCSRERAELKARAAALSARFRTSVDDCFRLFCRAQAIVCMGGYNTVCEALQSGVPTLVIPREGPSAEQRTRADYLSTLGVLETLPTPVDPAALAERAAVLLKRPISERELRLPMRGREEVARTLLALLRGEPIRPPLRAGSAARVFAA